MNKIKELREMHRMNMKQFAEYFGIPYRTVQNWEAGVNKCPEYLLKLMEFKLDQEAHLAQHRGDFKKLFDHLMADESLDKQLKDDAGMTFYPSIIIERFAKGGGRDAVD